MFCVKMVLAAVIIFFGPFISAHGVHISGPLHPSSLTYVEAEPSRVHLQTEDYFFPLLRYRASRIENLGQEH